MHRRRSVPLSREILNLEVDLLHLCRVRDSASNLEQGSGEGERVVKGEDEDEIWGVEEDEEEEESEIEEGIRPPYRRHKWNLVVVRSKIEFPEAYRRAEIIMIDDFNIGGGIPRIQWPDPGERRSGVYFLISILETI